MDQDRSQHHRISKAFESALVATLHDAYLLVDLFCKADIDSKSNSVSLGQTIEIPYQQTSLDLSCQGLGSQSVNFSVHFI